MNKTKYLKLQNQNLVKNQVRADTWCTNHVNCFRVSLSTKIMSHGFRRYPESFEHIEAKFKRYLHWRQAGCDVLVESILKKGLQHKKTFRPDLIIWNKHEIWIEEIVATEKEESIIKKKKNYPFKVYTYKA